MERYSSSTKTRVVGEGGAPIRADPKRDVVLVRELLRPTILLPRVSSCCTMKRHTLGPRMGRGGPEVRVVPVITAIFNARVFVVGCAIISRRLAARRIRNRPVATAAALPTAALRRHPMVINMLVVEYQSDHRCAWYYFFVWTEAATSITT